MAESNLGACANIHPCSLRQGGVVRAHRPCSRYICPLSMQSCLPKGIRITLSPGEVTGRFGCSHKDTRRAEQRSLLPTEQGLRMGWLQGLVLSQ